MTCASHSNDRLRLLLDKTVSLIMERDTPALALLLEEVSEWERHEEARRAMIDLVLGSDNLEIGMALFNGSIVESWCFTNAQHAMEHCPRLFGHWANNKPRTVQRIASILEMHDDTIKCSILDGSENSFKARYLREVLMADPMQWNNLSLAWLGEPHGALRQAANQAGWTPSRLAAMAKNLFDSFTTASWAKTMSYPYSLAAAALGADRIRQKQERQRAQQQGFLTGKPLNTMVRMVQCGNDANPVDVALAQLLSQKVGLRGGFVAPPNAVGLSSHDLGHLSCIVEMHLATNSLDVLVENLAAGKLAGYEPQEHGDLPSLDGLDY